MEARMKRWIAGFSIAGVVLAGGPLGAAEKLSALIVDGQNNHDWEACTPIVKWVLEESGRFSVEVSTSPPGAPKAPRAPKGPLSPEQKAAHQAAMAKWGAEKAALAAEAPARWEKWRPRFKDYAVVVCNYTGDAWPEEVRRAFVDYVRGGGGVVIVHAADNAFPDWPEYNEIIGVGGWGGRNEKSGPMVRWREGKIVLDTTPGPGGTHGEQHEYVIEAREPEHPILKGLPVRWRHAKDELYAKLRGPAKGMTVLATAYSAPETRGTGEHEPMLMTIAFGKGRVFHTAPGHGPEAMSGLGFQVTLARGTEWAATGKVTIPPPKAGELTEDRAAIRPVPGGR